MSRNVNDRQPIDSTSITHTVLHFDSSHMTFSIMLPRDTHIVPLMTCNITVATTCLQLSIKRP